MANFECVHDFYIFFRLLTIGKEDVTGVSMIAIRPKTNMDVSLLVKVKKVDSVKNIKAKLFCGTADSPVHMVKMDGQKFVIFPSIPLDGSECHITVEASATQASHRVKAGRVYFNADKPIEHHQVFFWGENGELVKGIVFRNIPNSMFFLG